MSLNAIKNKNGLKWLSGRGLYCVVPLLLTAFTFSGLLNDSFTNWDDDDYVINNPLIKHCTFQNIRQMFSPSSLVSANYQPVTILSLAISYAIGKLNPMVYIASDILLHLLNVLLVFVFVRKLTLSDRIAGIVAVLFGIHPMHVESVAWISGRKDVLYTFFFLSAILCYLRYREKKGRKEAVSYGLALIFFIVSLLSKSGAVTLPAILLLIDFYQRRKFTARLLLDKLPFLTGAIVIGIAAIQGQQKAGTLGDVRELAMAGRVLTLCYSYMFYVVKFFVPIKLSAVYSYQASPHPETWPLWYKASPFGVIASIGAAFYLRRNRAFVFGFFFFLISIVFLLRFVTVGATITNDRFSYVSYIGLFFIAASGFEEIVSGEYLGNASKALIIALGIFVIAILCFAAHQRCRVWKDGVALWTDVIDKDPKNPAGWEAYKNLGDALIKQGRTNDAILVYQRELSIYPGNSIAHTDYGLAYLLQGRPEDAIAHFQRAVAIDSEFEANHVNLSIYRKVVDLKNDYELALNGLGLALIRLGRNGDAIAEFRKALSSDPGDAAAYNYIGLALLQLGRNDEAISQYRKALDLDPRYVKAYLNLGYVLGKTKQLGEAAACFRKALDLNSDDMQTLNILYKSFIQIGQPVDAINAASRAMALAKASGNETLAQEIARNIEEIRRKNALPR